jgi:salicylate hydroxylase
VTLLGDAAHPMMPFMGQGAAQSIEDGFVLARCLAADRDRPERAVGAYAERRRERAAAMQAASREQGCDLQVSDVDEVTARNAPMRATPQAPLARYGWAWGYDVEKAIDPI